MYGQLLSVALVAACAVASVNLLGVYMGMTDKLLLLCCGRWVKG